MFGKFYVPNSHFELDQSLIKLNNRENIILKYEILIGILCCVFSIVAIVLCIVEKNIESNQIRKRVVFSISITGICFLVLGYIGVIFFRWLLTSKIPQIFKPKSDSMDEFVKNIKKKTLGEVINSDGEEFIGPYAYGVESYIELLVTEMIKNEKNGLLCIKNIKNGIAIASEGPGKKEDEISLLLKKKLEKFKTKLMDLGDLQKQGVVNKNIKKIGKNMSYILWQESKQNNRKLSNTLFFMIVCVVIIMAIPMIAITVHKQKYKLCVTLNFVMLVLVCFLTATFARAVLKMRILYKFILDILSR